MKPTKTCQTKRDSQSTNLLYTYYNTPPINSWTKTIFHSKQNRCKKSTQVTAEKPNNRMIINIQKSAPFPFFVVKQNTHTEKKPHLQGESIKGKNLPYSGDFHTFSAYLPTPKVPSLRYPDIHTKSVGR